MKLIEALGIAAGAGSANPPRDFFLACGFEPLHLRSFLNAHLQLRLPAAKVNIRAGLFGDLAGNIRRASEAALSGCAVVIEWSDVDPRLGLREAASWNAGLLPDILASSAAALGRIEEALDLPGESCPVALALPSLRIPPVAMMPALESGAFEIELLQVALASAARLAAKGRVRILRTDDLTPPSARYDIRSDMLNGFPYACEFADSLSGALARLLLPDAPKKGIITDLDETFWKGVLGDAGVDGVGWDLASHARHHGIYQQLLDSLAARGVLVGVASKNDAALVRQAFERRDLRMPLSRIYPLSVHWRPKSESVADILRTWNIGADSVVFVDDNPMEIAEVKAAHPGIECFQFPKDPGKLPALIERFRDWFGKRTVSAEDMLRAESIRDGAAWREASAGPNDSFEAFLSQAQARVTIRISHSPALGRPFELVNKTNQFNLNGRRYAESEWLRHFARPGAFLATAEYEDKFGPLGVVSAALGRFDDADLRLDSWVLSCRAFGRRIEHQFIKTLFTLFPAASLVLDYEPTGRNGPVREFLESFGVPGPAFQLTAARFNSVCPRLYHSAGGLSE
jgi:FkbH-like protein